MRNKFSSNLLGKGLISLAAASLLVSSAMATTSTSINEASVANVSVSSTSAVTGIDFRITETVASDISSISATDGHYISLKATDVSGNAINFARGGVSISAVSTSDLLTTAAATTPLSPNLTGFANLNLPLAATKIITFTPPSTINAGGVVSIVSATAGSTTPVITTTTTTNDTITVKLDTATPTATESASLAAAVNNSTILSQYFYAIVGDGTNGAPANMVVLHPKTAEAAQWIIDENDGTTAIMEVDATAAGVGTAITTNGAGSMVVGGIIHNGTNFTNEVVIPVKNSATTANVDTIKLSGMIFDTSAQSVGTDIYLYVDSKDSDLAGITTQTYATGTKVATVAASDITVALGTSQVATSTASGRVVTLPTFTLKESFAGDLDSGSAVSLEFPTGITPTSATITVSGGLTNAITTSAVAFTTQDIGVNKVTAGTSTASTLTVKYMAADGTIGNTAAYTGTSGDATPLYNALIATGKFVASDLTDATADLTIATGKGAILGTPTVDSGNEIKIAANAAIGYGVSGQKINIGIAGESATTAGTIQVASGMVSIASTVAEGTYDVTTTATVSSSTNTDTLSVLSIGAKQTTLSLYDTSPTGYKTVFSGRTGVDPLNAGDYLKFTESVAATVSANEFVDFSLSQGTFGTTAAGITESKQGNGVKLYTTGAGDAETLSTDLKKVTYVVGAASSGTASTDYAKLDITSIDLSTATAGDLSIITGGSSSVNSQTVKIAEVLDATTTTVADGIQTVTANTTFDIPEITITENEKTALTTSGEIAVILPTGVTLTNSTTTEITVKVNGSTYSAGLAFNAVAGVAKGAIVFTSPSFSSTAIDTITISGLKATATTSVAAGNISAIVSGFADDTGSNASIADSIEHTDEYNSNVGAQMTKESVTVGAIVASTIPSVATDGIIDLDDNVTTTDDKSLSATLTVAGNDAGKVGSVFVFTNKGNYITSTGVTTTATPFSASYDSINLGTHNLTIFNNVAIPTELVSGESIFVGYGVGFSVANAVANLNSQGTAVTADTLTDADLGVVTETPVVETPTGTTTGSVATSAEVSGTSSSVLASNGVVAGESTTTIGNTVLFNDRGFAIDYSNPANIAVTGIGANTIVSAEEVDVANVPAESQYRALVQETQYVKLTANKYLKVVVEKEVADEPVVTSATTPALVAGWNLLGNNSNNTQTVSKDGISITWTFDGTWTQDAPVPAGQGFWAKADADMAGYEFANSGDGTATPTFTAGSWSLMSSAKDQTLADLLTANSGSTVAWTFKGTTWYNAIDDSATTIKAGRGYWVK